MKPDFSKKPEGATHYRLDDWKNPWRMIDGENSHAWVNGKWIYVVLDDVSLYAPINQWDGTGLPPVGTVCEFTSNDGRNWRESEILFRDDQVVLIRGYNLYKVADPDIGFRPIRTPEQIAAEKYERDAEELAEILKIHEPHDVIALAKLVLDCGYRKQVAP